MRRLSGLTAVIWLSFCFAVGAEDSPAKNFLLMPVTTDLQRSLLSPSATAYAVINADALIQGDKIDAAALDLPTFRRELAALGKDRSGVIAVNFRFAQWQPQSAAQDLLEAAISQLCRTAGFEKVSVSFNHGGDDWQQHLKTFHTAVERLVEGDEPAVQDELVRVYPVRTQLSAWLTNNASCVVQVRQSIDGRSTGLPPQTRESIARFVEQLELPNKGILSFHVSSTEAGRSLVDRFAERDSRDPTSPAGVAHALGFAGSRIRHTPTSGAPETLLGKPAPDFTLASLDGSDIRLHDAIRGRAALVTFWGVACGPCQQEAPHLSALNQKHKDAGFTVIAVNAYNESREAVAEYVSKAGLKHPIVLMGRNVAREKYFVGAYPTTFWIDHNGIVQNYVIGFDAGDEARLSATAERMLRNREAK